MSFLIRKFFLACIFNSSLLIILFIGIQNNSIKRKVNFLVSETIDLPISFIVGSSFITGSIMGSLLNINQSKKN